MNKRKLLTLLVFSALLIAGCAPQSITKQRFVGNLMNGDIADKMIAEEPSLVTCFGGDRLTIWREIDNASDEALEHVGSYMPNVITGTSEYKAYVTDWGDELATIFFRDNFQRFTIDGLTHEQTRDCLKFYDENMGYFEKAAKK